MEWTYNINHATKATEKERTKAYQNPQHPVVHVHSQIPTWYSNNPWCSWKLIDIICKKNGWAQKVVKTYRAMDMRLSCDLGGLRLSLATWSCDSVLLSTDHDDVIKWKPFPRYWPFMRGIHRSPVNSPHKGQWRRALMFTLICIWINGCVNNREAGDLRRYCAHHGVTEVKKHDTRQPHIRDPTHHIEWEYLPIMHK